MNSYDIDGVIDFGPGLLGLRPAEPDDVIITGRSYEEEEVTYRMLLSRGIFNTVYFNPVKIIDKTRESSGEHKASILNNLRHHLRTSEELIRCHFEDDPIQAEIIKRKCPWLHVVFVDSYFVNK